MIPRLITLAAFYFLAYWFGDLVADQSFSGGFWIVLACSIIAATATTWIVHWFDSELMEAPIHTQRYPFFTARVTAAAALAITLIVPVQTLYNGHAQAAYVRSIASDVAEFGQSNFNEIDTDKSGILTAGELLAVLKSGAFRGAKSVEYLIHMHSSLLDVGHVISTEYIPTVILVPVGDGFTQIPSSVPSYTYGISRDDLNSYPARAKHKYRRW